MVSRLLIEYDGSGFSGWAKQPGKRTVQSVLEAALAEVLPQPVQLTVAGRTDAGTHSWGQVASYQGEPPTVRSVNAVLPGDIAVLVCEQAPDGFDARFDAVSRTYCYRVATRAARPALMSDRVLHWHWQHDRAALDTCAGALAGERDFQAFTLSDQPYASYRRVVSRAKWIERPGGILEFWIEADSFTRRMVRSLVAYQLDVARGLRAMTDFAGLLEGAPRSNGGGTAPATGLYLAAVGYEQGFERAVEFGEAPV